MKIINIKLKFVSLNNLKNMADNPFTAWEEDSSDDFFKEAEEATASEEETKEVIQSVLDEEEEVITEDSKKTPPSTKEENLFEAEEEDEGDQEASQEEDEELKSSSSLSTVNFLKEKGYIEFDLEEGEELSDEDAEDLLEDKWDESVEAGIADRLTGLPEDAQNLIQYILKGGSMSEYISSLQNEVGPVTLTSGLDLDVEENQIAAMRAILADEGKDEEEVDSEIEYLKDSGKLEVMSKKKFERYNKERKTKEQELIQAQAEKTRTNKENARLAKRKVIETLAEESNIGGIEVSRDLKKSVPDFMNDRVYKLANGSEISEMQKELFYELPKNETAMLQLAILLQTRNEDGTFNFNSIAKTVETNLTKEVKKEIRRGNNNKPNSTEGKSKPTKSLASYFSR